MFYCSYGTRFPQSNNYRASALNVVQSTEMTAVLESSPAITAASGRGLECGCTDTCTMSPSGVCYLSFKVNSPILSAEILM